MSNMKVLSEQVTCIVCPRGCRLRVEGSVDISLLPTEGVLDERSLADLVSGLQVTGNLCNRGVDYGKKEVTYPTRRVTSTVKIDHSVYNRLPVVTKTAVPKHKIFDVMKEINAVSVKAPVIMGDIILANVAGTGVDVVASRTMA